MRAYSQSKGQIIDVPDAGGAGMSQGGDMNKVFAAMMLKNPSKASAYKSVYELLNPSLSEADKKVSREKDEASGDAQKALENITLARQALERSGSGGVGNMMYGLREQLGGPFGVSDEQADTNRYLATLNEALFEVAGKAFTGTEKSLLSGKVLGIQKNKNVNKRALDEAERILRQKFPQMQTSNSNSGGGWE